MRKQRGVERGAMQQSNGDGKEHREVGGTKVSNSNNLSILFARVQAGLPINDNYGM